MPTSGITTTDPVSIAGLFPDVRKAREDLGGIEYLKMFDNCPLISSVAACPAGLMNCNEPPIIELVVFTSSICELQPEPSAK